jgi:hypothetical protein
MKGFNEDEIRSRHSEEGEELRRQIAEKEAILGNYRKEHGKLQVFFDRVINSITPIEPLPQVKHTRKGEGSPVVPTAHITDTHMGAVQDPYEIEGFNAFNPAIAEARSMAFADKFVGWVEMHRGSYNIRECAVIITGDLISGDIHDELKITNAFPSPVQVVESAKLIARQLGVMAPHFDRLTVHFISEDNHARLTKKPQAKEAGMNSFNYLVGVLLEAYVKEITNIVFNLYPMLEKVVDVNGRKYLICHGHNVRGWMGVPWYGIERKVGKEAQARLQLIMQEVERAHDIGFHKYIFGHFHTPFDSPLYSCGGSLSGTDAYDHQAGRYGDPVQSAWMVHAKHGEFNRINFILK